MLRTKQKLCPGRHCWRMAAATLCPLPALDFSPADVRAYLRRVYGESCSSKLASRLNVLNLTALMNVSVVTRQYVAALRQTFPHRFGWHSCWKNACDKGRFVPTFNVHTPLELAWRLHLHRKEVFRGRGHVAVANHSWAEVTHCGGSQFEHSAAYFYRAAGSGLWIRLGRTIAFGSHEEAVRHFLGTSCSRGPMEARDFNGRLQCDKELDAMASVARRRGYETVQFLQHCDAKCEQCPHEIAALYGGGGRTACPNVEMRRGSRAQWRCTCVPHGASSGTPAKPRRGLCASCAEWLG